MGLKKKVLPLRNTLKAKKKNKFPKIGKCSTLVLVGGGNEEGFCEKAVYVGDDGIDDLPLGCTSRLVEVDFLVDGDTLFLAHASGTLSHIKDKIELEVLGEQEGGLSAARKWDFFIRLKLPLDFKALKYIEDSNFCLL